MNSFPSILAQIYPSDLIGAEHHYMGTASVHQTLIIVGALIGASVVAVLMGLFYFKRKKRRRRHHHHHHEHPPVEKEAVVAKSTRRRKRRHRSKLPMNPTLAQTGGLPPVRDKNTPWP